MAKNEEENTGYITQSTRHSMLVSLSREINVISDENLAFEAQKSQRQVYARRNN